MPTYRRSDLFPPSRRWHKVLAIALPVVVLMITVGMWIKEMMR